MGEQMVHSLKTRNATHDTIPTQISASALLLSTTSLLQSA
jgi:hypothetical protein